MKAGVCETVTNYFSNQQRCSQSHLIKKEVNLTNTFSHNFVMID